MSDPATGLADRLLRFLPAATAGTFLAAMIYDAGYLSYAGYDWLSSLSIKDVFTLSWPILPGVFLAFISGGVQYGVVGAPKPLFLRKGTINEQWKTATSRKKPFLLAYLIAIAPAPLVVILGASWLFSSEHPERARFVFLGIFASFFLLARWIHNFIPENEQWTATKSLLFATAVAAVFGIGCLKGSYYMNVPTNDLVLLKDGRLCGTLVVTGENDLLLRTGPKRFTAIKWDQVRIYNRGTPCRDLPTAPVPPR